MAVSPKSYTQSEKRVFADVSIFGNHFWGGLDRSFSLINWQNRSLLKADVIINMKCNNEIHVNGLKFRVHPVYDQYAASACGKIVNIDQGRILLGNLSNANYLLCRLRVTNTKDWKMVLLHRFVYECYHGIIPDDLVIDHCNDDRTDNRLCNLQLVTPKENNIKAGKNRIRKSLPRPAVAINLTTGERYYFPSMNRVGKELGIEQKGVQFLCERIRRSAISNFDDYRRPVSSVGRAPVC